MQENAVSNYVKLSSIPSELDKSLTRPKAIIFDWDNTLANTWPTIHGALEKTFIEMGHTPWTLEETKDRVHRSLRDSFPEIFGDRWQEAGDKYLSHFTSMHLDGLEALNGAEDVLQALNTHDDIFVAIVSNKTGCNLRKEVTHIGWDKYFSKVIGAKDAAEDKPSTKPLDLALEGTDITYTDEIWFIGDSLTDMQCAHGANCTAIFYGDGDLSHDKFNNYQPHFHAFDHDELLGLIRLL